MRGVEFGRGAGMSTAMYSLCISQLRDDGYPGAAQAVADATGTPGSSSSDLPSRPLASILAGGPIPDSLRPSKGYSMKCSTAVGARPMARFSADGRTLAVGTGDGAISLYESETLLVRGSELPIRRYTSHAQGVNDIDFHPTSSIIVSASEDATLHFYDAAAPIDGPSRTCTDTHPVRSAAFHPQGDHLLVGTTHAALHLYDMATFRCFLAADASHHHRAALADARWSADGSLVASCAAGEVKVWDGASLSCVATLGRAHGGTPVGSACFSKSGRYVLTAGADSAVKLWDVRMLREQAASAGGGRIAPAATRTYEGGGQTAARRVAAFSHDERHIVGADEGSACALVWLAALRGESAPLGGELVAKCPGHAKPIRCIAHSPSVGAFVTCSDDGTMRAWAQ